MQRKDLHGNASSAQELAVATEVSRNRATPPDMLTDNSLSRRAYPAARAKISPRMGSRPAPGLARHVRVREAWRAKGWRLPLVPPREEAHKHAGIACEGGLAAGRGRQKREARRSSRTVLMECSGGGHAAEWSPDHNGSTRRIANEMIQDQFRPAGYSGACIAQTSRRSRKSQARDAFPVVAKA